MTVRAADHDLGEPFRDRPGFGGDILWRID
jgi:hypothetical protein